MQSEFQKRFCWGVLITYSCIVFCGELIHAIPGMECCNGCSSEPDHARSAESSSNREQPSSLAHCAFCEKRDRKSTAMEESTAIDVSSSVRSKKRIAIRLPTEQCQVCKMLAGLTSSLLPCSETARVSEIVWFAFTGEYRFSSNLCAVYSPRGPPQG